MAAAARAVVGFLAAFAALLVLPLQAQAQTEASTDATLSALALTDNDDGITLTPTFAPATTSYTAEVASSVDEITIAPTVNDSNADYEIQDAGGTALTDADLNMTGFQVALSEGANTIKMEVTAEDDNTTATYQVTVTRAATPTVSISADKTTAVLKGDDITYTLTRTGSTAAALPVTVALTQTKDFLLAAERSKTVTIAVGQSTNTFTVAATSFQNFAPGTPVEGGTLTAAVEAGTNYVPGTPASTDVAIVVRLTVGFEMASYSIAEEAGSVTVKLVARTGAGALTPDADVILSFSTAELDPLEAQIVQDYESVSETVTFATADFSADGSVFKAEKTVSVTIVDNAIDEQAERFALLLNITPGVLREYQNFVDTNGAACQDTRCPTLVTIVDTDPASADITGIEITSRPANGTSYLEGEAITVAVTYDQAVAVDTASGTPTLDLEIDVARAASYTSISSDNLVLTFSYTVAGDDQDQNGIVIRAGSIDLNGGAITGQGTSAAAHLAYPGLGKDSTQRVNRDPAVISGGVAITSSPTAKTDTYGVGEAIRFTVTFDTPVLGFRLANTGANPANKDLDYVSGSGTAGLTFEYVVQSGDTDTNGISVRNNWLDANDGTNGTITHATTGRAARLNHGRPGNNGNFPGHKVDGSLGPPIPADWSLKPSALSAGDQFRLIFLTSLGRVGSDTDIATYNTWIQGLAGSGHANIQAYGAAFNAVGCTASIDARDNTHTTYTNTNKGVPIYWLNGAKVADEYEDFYDGSWDDEVNDKNQLGFNGLDTSNEANYPWTGCDDNGTKATGMALGDTTPRVGRPNSTATGNGPIGSVTTKANTGHRPMYGLSAVFTVESDTAVTGAPTDLTATANGPEKIDLSWTAPSINGGGTITGYKIEFSINGGTTWYDLVADTGATDTTHSHRSNLSAGNTRHYRVSAINPGGAGPASNVAFATTAAADVLVSNTGQNGDPAATQAIGDQDKTHSQGFETGSNLAGYSLASVGVYVSDTDLAAGETFTVHIYTADGSGGLGALAYTLNSPNIFRDHTVNKFTAPDGATLAAGTAYHVVFQATGNSASDFILGVTSSNEQDTGSETRWMIEDARRFAGSPSSTGTNYKISVNGTAKPSLIPGDWSLMPTGLSVGDQFRLLFISSTRRDGVPTDIADYNTFIQDLAAAGHTDIQTYSGGFSVVGCTAGTDATHNTGTTGTGVPIYWLNGDPDNAKVADDYGDFYDGDWDEERQNKNRDESGNNGPNTSSVGSLPLTGCDHDGTERFSSSTGNSLALGASSVIVGRPNNPDSARGPIDGATTAVNSSLRPFYGLSTVFQVASSALPDEPTRLMATAAGQIQINLYWIAPANNGGLAITGYRIEVSSNSGVSWTDLVSNTNSDTTTYSHTGLFPGATRTYRVSAINPSGTGSVSNTAFASILLSAPAQVMGVMVEPGDMQLMVNWMAADNATGYKVQWKSGAQDYNTGDRQATITSGSTTTYTIPNLNNGTEYTVQVIATRAGANDGPPSMGTTGMPMQTELSLAPINPTVNETGGTVVLTVTLSPASSGTVTVDYATSDITADAGMDYTATSGTLTFMPGETSKTITITILNDTVYELTEHFRVTLSNSAGAALSAASLANVNISSDDAVPTASMEDVIVNEDAGTMTLTLALSHQSAQVVTYETTGSAVSGTATSPNDYLNFLQGAFTTITVPAGDMSATFDITLVDDMVNESDETIIIQWMQSPDIDSTPTSFTFTGTITDNEGTGVSVSRTALTVTEEDTTGDSYTVVLNTQPAADVTVTIAGHAGTDVTPDPPTLIFTPMNWDTAQTVTVTAGGDANRANETVSLTHSAVSTDTNYQGITIAGVTVTVDDNDVGVLVSNLGQSNGGHGDLLDFDQAQAFTTGSNSAGYTLISVEIEMFWNATQDASFAVSIHSDNSGAPGANLGTLTHPSPLVDNAVNAFTHTGIDLDASTTYFVVVDATGASDWSIRNTDSAAEDSTSAAGWSIGDGSLYRNRTPSGIWTTSQESKKLRVNGTVNAGPTGPGPGGGGPRQTVPDAPTGLMAEGKDGSVVLTWQAPETDDDAPITDYEYRIDGKGEWISIGSTGTTHTVTGLVNDTLYIFQVRVVSRVGRSRASDPAEATPRAPVALDFAHFANGSDITSDLVLVNVAAQPVRPALYFYDQEGQLMDPESVVDLMGDLEITEDGSLSVRTAMEPLGELTISTHGQGDLVSGSVRVVSDGPIGGVLRFDLPGIGVAGVGVSLPLMDAILPARRRAGGIATAAAIRNLEEEAMVVSCQLIEAGTVLEEVAIPLEANGQEAQYIEEMFTGADTSDFVGSVRCTAPGLFTGIAVELDAGNRIFTTLPVVPVDATGGGGRETVLDFAHFANGAGITSELVFVNRSTQPSRPGPTHFHSDILPNLPVLYFYDQGGALIDPASVVDVTGDLVVTEDSSLSIQTEMEPLGELTISTHGRGELLSGSVKVTSDRPLGGFLRFDLPDIGVAGVGVSLPVRDALFPARRQAGGISTAAAIRNLGEEAMEVNCRLMKDGDVLEETEIPLEASGQEALYIEEMFTLSDTSDFVGSVRCTAPPGEAMFTGVAVELDEDSRILTTLPVVPVPERMSQE